jgi:protein tyrosine/serine phosphatase
MRRRTKYALIALGVLAAGGLAQLFDTFVEDGNFYPIKRGDAYRSAQILGSLFTDGWDEIYARSKFKSLINLRGANTGEWYRTERTFAEERGAVHIDFSLSANKQPTLERTEELVALMRDAPRPLLLHCNQGADRTGLASALYAYAILGRPAEEAGRHLSILYGHFPWLINNTGAMDRAFAAYVAAHPPGSAGEPAPAAAKSTGNTGS